MLRSALNAMGTRFEIFMSGSDAVQLRALAEEAWREVERLDSEWSRFRERSEVARVNRGAFRAPVRVGAELMELLMRVDALHRRTARCFDPAAVVGFAGAWGSVELDPVGRTVRFRDERVRLDLGAIGKGYAVDEVVDLLRGGGVESALVHAGRSSVAGFGRDWRVGIPRLDAALAGLRAVDLGASTEDVRLLREVILRDGALGISATWAPSDEQIEGSLRRPHLLDPRTGGFVEGLSMGLVSTRSAADADALATAVVVGGEPLQRQLASDGDGVRSLRVTAGLGGGLLTEINYDFWD